MEFLFYMVACLGIIVLSMPLFSIASSLQKLAGTVEEADSKPALKSLRVK